MEEICGIRDTGERKISSGVEKQASIPEALHNEMRETRSNGLRHTVYNLL